MRAILKHKLKFKVLPRSPKLRSLSQLRDRRSFRRSYKIFHAKMKGKKNLTAKLEVYFTKHFIRQNELFFTDFSLKIGSKSQFWTKFLSVVFKLKIARSQERGHQILRSRSPCFFFKQRSAIISRSRNKDRRSVICLNYKSIKFLSPDMNT